MHKTKSDFLSRNTRNTNPMSNVTSFVNRSRGYLRERSNFAQQCSHRNLIENTLVHLTHLFSSNEFTKKDVFRYSDENHHASYYAVETRDTRLSLDGVANETRPFMSTAYESDASGVPLNIDIWNYNTVCNCGAELVETHYATIFDCNFQAYYEKNDCDPPPEPVETPEERAEREHQEFLEEFTNNLQKLPDNTCVCSICLECSVANKVQTKCNHVFHYECIVQWSKTCNSRFVKCPYCRANIIQ